MTAKITGWHSDPFGRHQWRYFSLDGKPTRLVSTAGKRSHDEVGGSPRWSVAPTKASPGPVAPHLPDASPRGTTLPGPDPLVPSTATPVYALRRGWRPDPYGRHEARYFSLDGKPTRLVSDAGKTSHDAAGPGMRPLLVSTAAASDHATGGGHQEHRPAGPEVARPVANDGVEPQQETDLSSSDSPVVGNPSGSAMNASEPRSTSERTPSLTAPPPRIAEQDNSASPVPIARESPTDAGSEGRKRFVLTGATCAAVALVTALVATLGPSGNGAPRRSTGAVSSTTATKTSVPASSRSVAPTTASTAVPSSTTPSTSATTTTLHTTATTETPTTRAAATTPAATTTRATTTTHPTTTTSSSTKPGSSVPVTTSPAQTRAATTTSTTEPESAPVTSFGNGTYEVGSQIVAQTYRAAGGTDCYWARLSSLGGTANDIIADNDALGPAIVTIAPSDAAFESDGCGTWSPVPTSGPEATAMGDGTWAVGTDIVAGTYQATSTGSCYWARLSSFSGAGAAIIANGDAAPGPFTVTINPTDVGFLSSGCGEWTLVS